MHLLIIVIYSTHWWPFSNYHVHFLNPYLCLECNFSLHTQHWPPLYSRFHRSFCINLSLIYKVQVCLSQVSFKVVMINTKFAHDHVPLWVSLREPKKPYLKFVKPKYLSVSDLWLQIQCKQLIQSLLSLISSHGELYHQLWSKIYSPFLNFLRPVLNHSIKKSN